jgi:hypothetical protein
MSTGRTANKNSFFVTHGSWIAVDRIRADGSVKIGVSRQAASAAWRLTPIVRSWEEAVRSEGTDG